ncbi:MAG: Uma2 family endonuclease [Actinomycetota bacterium]|nr:Uma2 family endonuclease [Actinomycetota bacterium]
MTASRHEASVHPGLLDFLEEHDIPYEVLDGCIVVSPPCTFRHEDVGAELLARLRVAAPDELAVLGSNFGFWYDDPSYVMPDISVARREDCEDRGTSVAPLLVVEVLSPTTRRRDLLGKWSIYAEAGVPSYWIVDPVEPSLTVLTLTDGLYVETARVTGSEPLTVTAPFEVTVRLQR